MRNEQIIALFGEIDPNLTHDIIIKNPAATNENILFASFQRNDTLTQRLSFPPNALIPNDNTPPPAAQNSEYALISALKAGNKAEAEQILSHLSALDNLQDEFGFSALECAEMHGFWTLHENIQQLLFASQTPHPDQQVFEQVFLDRIKECRIQLKKTWAVSDEKQEIRSLAEHQEDLLKWLAANVNDLTQNLESYALAASLFRIILLAPNLASLEDSLLALFETRDKMLKGTSEDYCFQPDSPVNRLYLSLAAHLFPERVPQNVVYHHTLLGEHRTYPWLDPLTTGTDLPDLRHYAFFRSSLDTIEIYENLTDYAIQSLKKENSNLENVWRGGDGARFGGQYSLSPADLDILRQRSPLLAELVDYTKRNASNLPDDLDLYGKLSTLRELLRENDRSHKGSEFNAYESTDPEKNITFQLLAFSTWWNTLGQSVAGRKLQEKILKMGKMRQAFDEMGLTRDRTYAKDARFWYDQHGKTVLPVDSCIQEAGRYLESAISEHKDELKKISIKPLTKKTPKELDALQRQILEELKSPPVNSIKTNNVSPDYYYTKFPELALDPTFGQKRLATFVRAASKVLTPNEQTLEQLVTRYNIPERHRCELSNPNLAGLAQDHQGRWYGVSIRSETAGTIHIHYLGWADKWDEILPRNSSRFVRASVFSTAHTRVRLIETLISDGQHEEALHLLGVFLSADTLPKNAVSKPLVHAIATCEETDTLHQLLDLVDREFDDQCLSHAIQYALTNKMSHFIEKLLQKLPERTRNLLENEQGLLLGKVLLSGPGNDVISTLYDEKTPDCLSSLVTSALQHRNNSLFTALCQTFIFKGQPSGQIQKMYYILPCLELVDCNVVTLQNLFPLIKHFPSFGKDIDIKVHFLKILMNDGDYPQVAQCLERFFRNGSIHSRNYLEIFIKLISDCKDKEMIQTIHRLFGDRFKGNPLTEALGKSTSRYPSKIEESCFINISTLFPDITREFLKQDNNLAAALNARKYDTTLRLLHTDTGNVWERQLIDRLVQNNQYDTFQRLYQVFHHRQILPVSRVFQTLRAIPEISRDETSVNDIYPACDQFNHHEGSLDARTALLVNLLSAGKHDTALKYLDLFLNAGTLDSAHALATCFNVFRNKHTLQSLIDLFSIRFEQSELFGTVIQFSLLKNHYACINRMFEHFPEETRASLQDENTLTRLLMSDLKDEILHNIFNGSGPLWLQPQARTASPNEEARQKWTQMYQSLWDMYQYGREISRKSFFEGRDYQTFAISLLQKVNHWHQLPEDQKRFSALEQDLKNTIHQKIPEFKHRSGATRFMVKVLNILFALTSVREFYQLITKKPLIPPTCREQMLRSFLKTGGTLFKPETPSTPTMESSHRNSPS